MRKKWLWAIPVFLIGMYLSGPKPATPLYKTEIPVVPADATQLELYIKNNEAQHKIKPDNEARIIWANDSLKQKTEYAIVYLHGFSASQAEGDPIHKNTAKEFGCNLYLSRMAEHGIDTVDALINLTADKYWESAKQALAIGKQLGKKVILMGTSTGGTSALQLAATYTNDVAALILMSPNIAINDPTAWLLNNHWGLQIVSLLKSNYITDKDNRPVNKQYWNWQYRVEAVVALEEMLETAMNKKTFEKVKQPVLLLYFYKDEQHQDSRVKVSAMLDMYNELGVADSLKRKQSIPDAGSHIIGSYIQAHDVEGVQKEIEKFIVTVLKIKEVKN